MPGKILLADDDADLLLLTELALSEAGYQVTAVSNGKEVLDATSKASFDLILLDADMPIMNGFETFMSLAKNPLTAAVPVVFLTAYPPDSMIFNELGVSQLHYLLKPYDLEELIRELDRILQNRISQNP